MLTLFSIPKPFEGATTAIQRNALASWVSLRNDVQVVLVGDEPGVAEAAEAYHVLHLGSADRTSSGTPRVDSAFAAVDGVAEQPLRCFVNADVVLLADLLPAVRILANRFDRFLLVGRTVELPTLDEGELADPARLRARARDEGTVRGAAAMDWFVFTPALFGEMPPFAVGRAGFDNWLVWRARRAGPVIDGSAAVCAIHQAHAYTHLEGGKEEAYGGPEAAENIELAGGRRRVYTLHDADYRLTASGSVRRRLGAVLRSRETARKVAWKLGRR